MINLKIYLLTKGYKSITAFCKDKEINYQNFRNLITKNESSISIKDAINLSKLLEITFYQCIEFFLPTDFKIIKELDEKFKNVKTS